VGTAQGNALHVHSSAFWVLQEHAFYVRGFSPGHQARMLPSFTEICLCLMHLWTSGTEDDGSPIKPWDRNLPLDQTSRSFVFTWTTSHAQPS